MPGEGPGEAQPRWREGLLERGWGTGRLRCFFPLQQGSKGEGERRECPPDTYIYIYLSVHMYIYVYIYVHIHTELAKFLVQFRF